MIVANWKMHKTRVEAIEYFEHLVENKHILEKAKENDIPCVIAPPAYLLYPLHDYISHHHIPVKLAAQNIHQEANGAYTGQMSAVMLKDTGIKYIILGHSEVRQYQHETDDIIYLKVQRALAKKLKAILCVGESAATRESGHADKFILSQLELVKTLDKQALKNVIIAYEPIWAIGTGNSCSGEEANRVAKLIRDYLGNEVSVLYGGSVTPENIRKYLSKDIIGGLIGSSALNPANFLAMVEAKLTVNV